MHRSDLAALPPGLPLRPPGLSRSASSISPSVTYPISQPQLTQTQIQHQNSHLPQLPFPHRPFHPIYNNPSVPHQSLSSSGTSRTPSQTTSISSFPASSIQTPPLPSGFSHPPSISEQPFPAFSSATPPPPPNLPPGSHSTFLTRQMSAKEAASHNVPHPPSLPPPTLEELEKDPTTLSRFARLYIPLWLRQVNTSFPSLVFPLPPSTENDTYSSMVSDLYPPKLLSKLIQAEQDATARVRQQLSKSVDLSKLSTDYDSKNPSTKARPLNLPPLSPSTYAAHWIPLQALEYNARQYELYESTLYNVLLRPFDSSTSTSSPSSTTHLYSLPTPFIRESWPPVQMGDTCFIRPLIPEIQGWKGVEVEARVYAIERIKGEVVLSVDQYASGWLKQIERGGETGQRSGEKQDVETETEVGISVNVIWKIQGRALSSLPLAR